MKQIWEKALPSIYNTWFRGALIKEDQCLKYYFFFPASAKLSSVTFDAESGEVLNCDQNIHNGLNNEERYTTRKPPEHYSEDDFVFGEYRIMHQGNWGYACFKNDTLLWEKSLRGYLYTDIFKIGDRIIFGTAGFGGHLYSLDINNGEIIFDFNTKGTCVFLQVNNSVYFAMSKKKTTIIYRIDYDGNILESLELEGSRDDYDCPFALWDESIYIVTQLRKKELDWETYYPIVHRIALF